MPVELRENLYRMRELPRDEEILKGRAELLAPRERDLFEAVVIHSQSAASVGRMMNLSPRAVRQRLHRISRKLTSRTFLDVARALPYLPKEDARLARQYFCQRTPQRKLCRQMGITQHALRRKLDRLSAEIATLRRLQRSRPNGRGFNQAG